MPFGAVLSPTRNLQVLDIEAFLKSAEHAHFLSPDSLALSDPPPFPYGRVRVHVVYFHRPSSRRPSPVLDCRALSRILKASPIVNGIPSDFQPISLEPFVACALAGAYGADLITYLLARQELGPLI